EVVFRQPNVVKSMVLTPRNLIENLSVKAIRCLPPLRRGTEVIPKTETHFFNVRIHCLNILTNFCFFQDAGCDTPQGVSVGPPEALIRSPVSHGASSDARETITGAISSGLPNLADCNSLLVFQALFSACP